MLIPVSAPRILILAVGVAFIGSILATWRFSRHPTIQRYFWGDQKLPSRLSVFLLLTESFSLNGLLYQIWVGYSLGFLSLVLQAAWCLSFFVLSSWSKDISRNADVGTMHGIISRFFTPSAGRLAAVCSVIGAASMIGWEFAVGAQLFYVLVNRNLALTLMLAAVILLGLLTYTLRGGLRANLRANIALNITKAAGLVFVCLFLWFGVSPAADRQLYTLSAWKFTPPQMLVAVQSLTVVGFVTNLLFSFFWQFAEMQTWQNISATTALQDNRKSALRLSSILAFFFPGVLGTLIGVGLTYLKNLNADSVLVGFVSEIGSFQVVIFFLFLSFACAMLTTVDGYCLAAAQSVTWDILQIKKVKSLLLLGSEREGGTDDSIVISEARLSMVIVAVVGSCTFLYLRFGLEISLFDLVYCVAIAQMAMVPLMLTAIRWQRFPANRQRSLKSLGLPALASGLVAGFSSVLIAIVMGRGGRWQDVYFLSCMIGALVSWAVLQKSRWQTL